MLCIVIMKFSAWTSIFPQDNDPYLEEIEEAAVVAAQPAARTALTNYLVVSRELINDIPQVTLLVFFFFF